MFIKYGFSLPEALFPYFFVQLAGIAWFFITFYSMLVKIRVF